MSEQDITLINAYLEGTLSKKDQSIFDKKIIEDNVFKEQVHFEIQMQESLSDSQWSFIDKVNNKEVQEYKNLMAQPQTQELKNILKNLSTTKTTKQQNTFKIWYCIAAVLLISISLFTLFNADSTSDNLYATYINTDEIPSLVVRSENTNQLNTIQQLFDDKKYEELAPLITEALISKSQSGGTLIIIKGISQIETNKNEDALNTFERLINSEFLDSSKGYWYKALTYLKVDDLEKCKSVLKHIIKNNSYNNEKAKQLLEELS